LRSLAIARLDVAFIAASPLSLSAWISTGAAASGLALNGAKEDSMTTVRLWTDDEVEKDPAVKAVFDDIRRARKSDFVNNFWRALANDPATLKRTWESLKAIMGGEGALDPLTRELIYIAVSAANGCSYCIHSHTAAAKQKGMTEAQHMHLLAIIGMASETNNLVTAMQIPVDREFLVGE
jgi:AhpD family alkylhydroperoxidase